MEFKRIALLTLCLAACISVGFARAPKKIVRGQKVEEGEFPYQVSLQYRWTNSHFCGGAILDATHILTAAHCVVSSEFIVKSLESIQVVTGVTDNQAVTEANTFRVSKIDYHKSLTRNPTFNDIAILKLSSSIPFNAVQKPIRLPTRDTPSGALVTISGWGDTWADADGERSAPASRYLRKLDMKALSLKECKDIYRNRIVPEQICVQRPQGSGLCDGDSGGPLIYKGELIGIASWVFNSCATKSPDVFTRVYDYLPWIKNATQDASS